MAGTKTVGGLAKIRGKQEEDAVLEFPAPNKNPKTSRSFR